MDANELQALSKIEGRLGRLEALQEATVRTTTELTANVNRLVEKLDRSDDIAREALNKAEYAHQQIGEIADNQRWLWRTVIGGLIASAIAAFVKFKGG